MNLKSLEEAIKAIACQVGSPQAHCIIAHEGTPDESSLMGTCDGYLNLALVLLRFVADAAAGRHEVCPEGYIWDDGIKNTMYQLPDFNFTWIVGCYLFDCHAGYMEQLSRTVDPQLKYPLLNDPQFIDPNHVQAGRSLNQP